MKTHLFKSSLQPMSVILSCCLFSSSVFAMETTGDISLKQAIQNTLENHPELKKYPFDIRYQQALSQQAGIKPVPQLSIQAEDLIGTEDYQFADKAQLTLTLSRNYEMGDKLQHRLALSQSKEDSKQLEFELSKVDIVAETTRRFYELIHMQQLAELLNNNISKQKSLNQKIKKLAEAGIANPVDQNRIRLLIKQSKHQLLAIKNQQDLARTRLSSMWQEEANFNEARGSFNNGFSTPSKEQLLKKIEQSPVQLHYLALQREADHNLKLEQAYGVQDITYSVGVRHKASEGAQTINFGMSLPLAFNNPNQGRIEAAKIRLQESLNLQSSSTQKLKLEVIEYWQAMQNMQQQIVDIDKNLLPESSNLISTSLASYQRGSTSLLQVMEAQQIWFELKTKQLELSKQTHLTLLEIERLLGSSTAAE